jgi:signal transduction histidine kinase
LNGLSVRWRTTLATLLVVAIGLSVAGASLVWMVHRSLFNDLVSSSTAEAQNVAGLAASGDLPSGLQVKAGTAAQVVDQSGRVLARSPDLTRPTAVSQIRPKPGVVTVFSVNKQLEGDDDNDIVVATTVQTPYGLRTVYVINSDERVESPTRSVALSVSVAFPLLLAMAGVLAWILTGAALRPVEAIRAEVADLSAGDLHRRVPEPHTNDEIARLARTMNAMLDRLEQSAHQQRQFVSDASHELRSPIASVLAQVEVAAANPTTSDWPAVAAGVADEATRLWRIVDDLLLLARSDEGEFVVRKEPVDLDEVVLAESVRLRAHDRVTFDLSGVSAGRVLGDREQLRRLVRNLVDNAERHARSTVSLGVSRTNGRVELAVADDGPGIAPEDRERVFERFARLEESRDRPTGGTGLGLAIVGEIASVHGGTVSLSDGEPGAQFVVSLPAAPD